MIFDGKSSLELLNERAKYSPRNGDDLCYFWFMRSDSVTARFYAIVNLVLREAVNVI